MDVYDKKGFVGGAAMARRNARRKRSRGPSADRTCRHTLGPFRCEKKKTGYNTRIPNSVKPFDRFFASLLRSTAKEFVDSEGAEAARIDLLSDVCGRAGLPLPAPLTATSKDAHHFYTTRASLVMEEARFVIADALNKGRRDVKRWRDDTRLLHLRLVSMSDKERLGAKVLIFEKLTPRRGSGKCTFASEALQDMRPGCCFEIMMEVGTELLSSHLATVVPMADHSNLDFQLCLMLFHENNSLSLVEGETYRVRPLAALISEARQFEACTRETKVPFLSKLFGWKDATHIRFDDTDESDNTEDGDDNSDGNGDACVVDDSYDETDLFPLNEQNLDSYCPIEEIFSTLEPNLPLPLEMFNLPKMNATQERAAAEFLAAPPSSLTLVVGPPGTGKTTFTVSVLLRSLCQKVSRGNDFARKRILVTAPTNKAITVLVLRFLEALNKNDSFNVALIGVQDKLLVESNSGKVVKLNDAMPSTLRDIFVYTWIENTADAFQSMLDRQQAKHLDISALIEESNRLRMKMKRSIPNLFNTSGVRKSLDNFIFYLESSDKFVTRQEVSVGLDHVKKSISQLDQRTATQELLATAHVIFSTLSTAGVSAMKMTRRVDELFVDEAAAATEPEIVIPFHLRPGKMLAVGDPMQLPSTVMSRHASNLGLSKSLHERLLLDCKKQHVMLDVQYRMKPDICMFPSNIFYGGNLHNGPNVVSLRYGERAKVLPFKPFTFMQIEGCERQSFRGSYSNFEEALKILDILQTMKERGESESWHSPDKLRVITFYQAQASTIRSLLHRNGLGCVLVATVDSCQGCEADIIILSFVRSNKKLRSAQSMLGFLLDDRRLNVSLTRARYQLICVGDIAGTLAAIESTTLAALAAEARRRDCIINTS
jgi:hypothetical protein